MAAFASPFESTRFGHIDRGRERLFSEVPFSGQNLKTMSVGDTHLTYRIHLFRLRNQSVLRWS